MTNDSQSGSFFRHLFSDPKLALMLALGFSSGLPFRLIYSTQSTWLREAKIPIETIGLFFYATLAYSLKFLWAPLMERYDAPIFGPLLGRKRGWMVLTQIMIIAALLALGLGDPAQRLLYSFILAVALAFASASQDVVVDGWRIVSAPQEQQGIMSTAAQYGYQIALFCSGAGSLYLAQYFGWRTAYWCMAALMLIGLTASWFAAEPPTPALAATERRRFLTVLKDPVMDLFQRFGSTAVLILALIALFRLPDYVSGVMANPLYIDLGFSKDDIATVTKIYGFWIGLAGIFVGGVAVLRLGIMPALIIGSIAASSAHLSFALLATKGANLAYFVLAISCENFSTSFAGCALIAYLSSLTSPAFAATQYALFASIYALPGKLVGGLSGYIAKALGYPLFFICSAGIGIPVIILCLVVGHRQNVLATKTEKHST